LLPICSPRFAPMAQLVRPNQRLRRRETAIDRDVLGPSHLRHNSRKRSKSSHRDGRRPYDNSTLLEHRKSANQFL
jgi:hypothetical protein